MNIQVRWQLEGQSDFDQFLCEAVIDAVNDAAMIYAPELVETKLFAEWDFQSCCEGACKIPGIAS